MSIYYSRPSPNTLTGFLLRTFKIMRRRKAKDLYADLNAPIRNKTRAPLPQQPTSARSVHVRNPPTHQPINTKNFRIIENTQINVENVILTSRKEKEEIVQDFIRDFRPPPIQILQKIAQVSQPHKSILKKIVSELQQFPEEDLEEPLHDLSRDALTKMTVLRLKTHDTDSNLTALKKEEEDLLKLIEIEKHKNELAKEQHEKYKLLTQNSTFDIYNAEMRELEIQQQLALAEKEKLPEDTMKYNALWGENKHLKTEITRTLQKIDENHEYQLSTASKFAQKTIDEEQAKNGQYFPDDEI